MEFVIVYWFSIGAKKIEFNLFVKGVRLLLIKLISDFIDKNFKFDTPTSALPSTKIKK